MALLSGSSAEPQARLYHAAACVEGNMLIISGYGSENEVPSALETYHVPSMTWQEQRQLSGQSLPDNFCSMAVASDGERAYLFGGYTGSRMCCNTLYEVDLTSLECTELVPATDSLSPIARWGSQMVFSEQRKLVVYGGRTDAGLTDELLVFDLDTSEAVELLQVKSMSRLSIKICIQKCAICTH